jgi:hypothetical protein
MDVDHIPNSRDAPYSSSSHSRYLATSQSLPYLSSPMRFALWSPFFPFPSLFRFPLSYVEPSKFTMKTCARSPLWYCITVLALLNATVCIDLPLVDFNRMGTVGLVGAFAGLNFFNSSSANVSFDPTTSTLLSRSADSSLTHIASTNAGRAISAGCAIANTYYLAGNFSSIGNTTVSNVVSYNPASGAFSAHASL